MIQRNYEHFLEKLDEEFRFQNLSNDTFPVNVQV